jgi:aminopeptidase N
LRRPALVCFHAFKNEELRLDCRSHAGVRDRGGQILPAVRQLMKHADFSMRNPNRARSHSVTAPPTPPFHCADAAGQF